MQAKALTIAKGLAEVVISVPAVIFRAATRFAGSLVADIVCLFMGPMRLYNNIKPTGKGWIAFVFQVLGLSIYNSIALILNATLGLLYNLVESAFMTYELWTAGTVTVKELYRSGDKNEKKENEKEEEHEEENEKDKNENGEQKNVKLVLKFLVGMIDIKNKMSDGVTNLCNKINKNSIFQTVSKKVVELINKLFAVTKQSKEESKNNDIDNTAKKDENNLEESNNMDKLIHPSKTNNIEAAKPYSLDSIFHPIHSFRAK